MGDTLVHSASGLLWLMGLWGCGDRGSDLDQIHRLVCRADRTGAEPAPLGMDVSELDLSVTRQPVAVLSLGDTNRFAGQRFADKDQFASPLDLAVAARAADRDIAAAARVVDPVRVGPRRRLVQRSRRLLSQRLMGPLVVVDGSELGIERAKLRPQLLWSPTPAPAQIHDRLHHRDIMGLAMAPRRVRALHQARRAVTAIPPEPLVAGLAADPVLSAPRRHLISARQNPSDKLRPFVHLTGIFPRHRQAPPADSSNPSPFHPVNSVTNLPGSYTGPSLSPLPVACGEREGRLAHWRRATRQVHARVCTERGAKVRGSMRRLRQVSPEIRARGLWSSGGLRFDMPGDHVIVLPAGWNIDTLLRRAEMDGNDQQHGRQQHHSGA